MVQKVITLPAPILRKQAKPVKSVDKKVLKIIGDLEDTLASQKHPTGVGISAPQIGGSWQICLVRIGQAPKPTVLINPKVVWQSKQTVGDGLSNNHQFEGCLSVPGLWGPVKRPQQVKVQYLTTEGQTKTEKFTDFAAVVAQHEIDHLNGILFIDQILQQKGRLYKIVKDEEEKDIFKEVKITP